MIYIPQQHESGWSEQFDGGSVQRSKQIPVGLPIRLVQVEHGPAVTGT